MATAGSKFLDFVLTAYGVKLLPRTGWVRHGITGTSVEHVGDHMWGMSLMTTLLLSDIKDVDSSHVVKLCMVHDLAESIVGDLTPYCGVSKEEKAVREREAMIQLSSTLPSIIGSNLLKLFEEFEEKATPEAVVAHDMDKLDMVLQAYVYEQKSKNGQVALSVPKIDLSEFYGATSSLTANNDESLSDARRRLAEVVDALAQRRATESAVSENNSTPDSK